MEERSSDPAPESPSERTRQPSHYAAVFQGLQYTEYMPEAESIKGMERGVVLLGEKERPGGWDQPDRSMTKDCRLGSRTDDQSSEEELSFGEEGNWPPA